MITYSWKRRAITAALLLLPIRIIGRTGEARTRTRARHRTRPALPRQRHPATRNARPGLGLEQTGSHRHGEIRRTKESAKAGADGKWMLKLKPLTANAEPAEMVVQDSEETPSSSRTSSSARYGTLPANRTWNGSPANPCSPNSPNRSPQPGPKSPSANSAPTPSPPSIRKKGEPRKPVGEPAAWLTVSPPSPSPSPTNSTRNSRSHRHPPHLPQQHPHRGLHRAQGHRSPSGSDHRQRPHPQRRCRHRTRPRRVREILRGF